MESLCSWIKGSGDSWRWVLGGVRGIWRGTLSCTPWAPPQPLCLLTQGHPSTPPKPCPRWATAEYENRQEKPSWSFPGMQTVTTALLFFVCAGESHLNCIKMLEIPRCRSSVAITIPTFLSPNALLTAAVTLCFGKVRAACESQGQAGLVGVRFSCSSQSPVSGTLCKTTPVSNTPHPQPQRILSAQASNVTSWSLTMQSTEPQTSSRPEERRQERKPAMHDRC